MRILALETRNPECYEVIVLTELEGVGDMMAGSEVCDFGGRHFERMGFVARRGDGWHAEDTRARPGPYASIAQAAIQLVEHKLFESCGRNQVEVYTR